MDQSVVAIRAFAQSIFPAAEEVLLLLREIDPAERQGLAAHLIPEGPLLCYYVSRALICHPELFPDQEVDGAALAALQERATALRLLRSILARLLQQVQDNYLKD